MSVWVCVECINSCPCNQGVWCIADRIQWALVQLLLLDAQLTHPGE